MTAARRLDLTPGEHEHSEAIGLAARWIIDQGDLRGRAIIPELKTRFGITTLEACASCKEATAIRARAT